MVTRKERVRQELIEAVIPAKDIEKGKKAAELFKKPTFVGGGGFTPAPTQTDVPVQTEVPAPAPVAPPRPLAQFAEQAILARELRERAREEEVSPQVQLARERTFAVAEEKRFKAEERRLEEESVGGRTTREGVREFFFPSDGRFQTLQPTPEEVRKEQTIPIAEQIRNVEGQVNVQNVKLADVDFGQFFEPDRAKLEREAKIDPQTFVEAKFVTFAQPLLEKIPEGKVKDVLSKEVPIRITDVGKFVLFEPLIATSPVALETAIARGGLKPQFETKFVADVVKTGKTAEVKLGALSESGGLEISTLSKQTIKQLDSGLDVGTGTAVSARRIGGTAGDVEFSLTKFIGAGERLGITGRRATIFDGIKLERELVGGGVRGQALSAETAVFREFRGLRFGVPRFTKSLGKDVKLKGSTLRVDLQPSRVTGFFKEGKQVGDFKLSTFVGTTAKPTTALTPRGFVKRIPLEDINIRGIVRTTTKTDEGVGKLFLTTGTKKTPLSQTFKTSTVLDKEIQKSITIQSSVALKQAERSLVRDIVPTRVTRIVPKAVRVSPKTRRQQTQVTQVPQGRFDIDLAASRIPDLSTSRVSTLGIPRTRLDTLSLTGQAVSGASRIRQKTRQKTKTVQKDAARFAPRVDVDVRQRVKTGLRIKQILKTTHITRPPTIPIITPPRITRTPTPIIGGRTIRPKVKKVRRRRRGRIDALGFSETFTQRQFLLDLDPKVLVNRSNLPRIVMKDVSRRSRRKTPVRKKTTRRKNTRRKRK